MQSSRTFAVTRQTDTKSTQTSWSKDSQINYVEKQNIYFLNLQFQNNRRQTYTKTVGKYSETMKQNYEKTWTSIIVCASTAFAKKTRSKADGDKTHSKGIKSAKKCTVTMKLMMQKSTQK